MKYIVFWEWDMKATEEGIAKTREIDELKKEFPDMYPRSWSFNGSFIRKGWHSGFTLFDATEEQLKKWKEFYEPVLRITDTWQIVSASDFIKEFESKMEKR